MQYINPAPLPAQETTPQISKSFQSKSHSIATIKWQICTNKKLSDCHISFKHTESLKTVTGFIMHEFANGHLLYSFYKCFFHRVVVQQCAYWLIRGVAPEIPQQESFLFE